MIKNSSLKVVYKTKVSDGQGGYIAEYSYVATIPAHVSVITTTEDITQFGIKTEQVLHTVTSTQLNDKDKYEFDNKKYQIVRQTHVANEYYQVMKQIM